MLIKVTILTDRAALPEADDGVLKIEEEESFDVNPFYTGETDLGKTIEQFAINDRWQPAQDDNDPRLHVHPTSAMLPEFMDYARKRRSNYKKAVSEGRWMRAQKRCLKTLVLRFFDVSNAAQSTQALLRAASARTSAATSSIQAADAAAPLNSNRLDRAPTRGDLTIVVRNQQTLMTAINRIRKAVIQLNQKGRTTRSRNKSNMSDEEGDERYQIELLSDDDDTTSSPSASRSEDEALFDDDDEIGEN
ncbi:hypothetical protein BGX30_007110, partial [Mortierella sp. GBA39]